MEPILKSILENKTENYLLPFFWQHDGHDAEIPARVQKIYESGCRAFCVESRPYEHFCEDAWWKTMDIILAEAEKRSMRVWILDDKHFPTGYANGILEHEDLNLRRKFLRESHVDVMGPIAEASVLVPMHTPEEKLVSAVLFRRTGKDEELTGEPIELDVQPEDKFVYFSVPEGLYRVFFVFETFSGEENKKYYIDMLSKESVHKLIEAVYEPHYDHYAKYFGNTLAGFFSDEPGFDAPHFGMTGCDTGIYNRSVGQPGVMLPWRDAAAVHMAKDGIDEPTLYLPILWYAHDELTAEIRLAYMDAVTLLWKENFSYQLGDWCRSHGVQYIGHLIEDMNAHARLGCSAGHYFRGLDGQDMSGIDIVLHQVMPGMADYKTAALVSGGMVDGEFFHYVLGQLAASHARQNPNMNGRAMCEVFGAYGWAEGANVMKWLMDFLLVRGVNHFVPHAFDDFFPDRDCPPHFGADGNDPQFAGFTQLMHYVNRAAHYLYGTEMEASGAILYHAEAEWMDKSSAMLTQKPAKACYDAQISYDIVPFDYLETAEKNNGRFGRGYKYLIVPACRKLPERFAKICEALKNAGVPVFFVDYAPDCVNISENEIVPLQKLAAHVKGSGLAHEYNVKEHLLRIAKFTRGEATSFFVFNEAPNAVQETLSLPVSGKYIAADLLNGVYTRGETADGTVEFALEAGQSVILIFGGVTDDEWAGFPEKSEGLHMAEIETLWDIDLRETGKETEFKPFRKNSKLFNITGKNGETEFSGEMRYQTKLNINDTAHVELEFENVGVTAQLFVNGKDMGQRICRPYRWDITEAVKAGENDVEVFVCNTLAQRMQDFFSTYMTLPASGITGKVRLFVQ